MVRTIPDAYRALGLRDLAGRNLNPSTTAAAALERELRTLLQQDGDTSRAVSPNREWIPEETTRILVNDPEADGQRTEDLLWEEPSHRGKFAAAGLPPSHGIVDEAPIRTGPLNDGSSRRTVNAVAPARCREDGQSGARRFTVKVEVWGG
ncbi:hypothetical protein LTR60_002102 [Cryomyces antarcticus]|nr:hypothetical protein LTR39_002218 [Cryomyces antarcticus]KAK5017075.1 hypothetical protein LTR60_002102 [Cryomyces antarcticus]